MSLLCSHWTRNGYGVSPASTPRSSSAIGPVLRSRYWNVVEVMPRSSSASSTPSSASISRLGGWNVDARDSVGEPGAGLEHGHR